jgi:hypothetical protein
MESLDEGFSEAVEIGLDNLFRPVRKS